MTGCTIHIDSYLTDPSGVQCDGARTKTDLPDRGLATFIVHGETEDDIATITVRQNNQGVSVRVTGDVTGPPQVLADDGFTHPTSIVDGPELNTLGAGGAWIIDARSDGTVVIQGNCDGM